MLIQNLSDDRTMSFGDSATMVGAVCYAYAADNNLISKWSATIRNTPTIQDWIDAGFPVCLGSVAVACGDWCAI